MRIFILVLALVSMYVFGNNEGVVSIKTIGNQYSISYFNYKPEILAHFEGAELQGGGYTWEALVTTVVSSEFPSELKNLDFDSEGDTFIAYTESEITANKVKSIIEKLSSDIVYLDKYIKIAKLDGNLE